MMLWGDWLIYHSLGATGSYITHWVRLAHISLTGKLARNPALGATGSYITHWGDWLIIPQASNKTRLPHNLPCGLLT